MTEALGAKEDRGGYFFLSFHSLEGNHTLCLKNLPGWFSEAFSWLSHSHGNSRGYSKTCGGLGRMTPEAWHGPWWLLCQTVAGQEHKISQQKPGPTKHKWEESWGAGAGSVRQEAPRGLRSAAVHAGGRGMTASLCLAMTKPLSSEGSVSSELQFS